MFCLTFPITISKQSNSFKMYLVGHARCQASARESAFSLQVAFLSLPKTKVYDLTQSSIALHAPCLPQPATSNTACV